MVSLEEKIAVVFAASGKIAGTDAFHIKGVFNAKSPNFR
jgi:hypothetical protein